jgi:hypothetical protein
MLNSDTIQKMPFEPDGRYELRGKVERVRNGTRLVWMAYRNGFPVYEIVKSADPNLVAADLSEWLEKV